jgi:RNA polymerase sigma-70 factor (sigma-E family)
MRQRPAGPTAKSTPARILARAGQPERPPDALTLCDDATHAGRPVVSSRRDDEFTQYVTARLGTLRRLAFLLCQDWHHADDLVQATITRLYVHWARASALEHTDAYARTILVREFLGEQRSGWARRVSLHAVPPDRPGAVADTDAVLDVRAALAAIPPRQRATLVLRFYCDLSVEQTAELLGCSAGTVKSQTAKGIAALRTRLGPPPLWSTADRAGPLEVIDHG